MSRGTEYLNYVTKQLTKRLQETDTAIQDVRKDIAGMNEYYWENYTEMDEYGYENYDNRQALASQVNAGQEYRRQRDRWRKMLEFDQVFIIGGKRDHPFFRQFRYICATRALHELYVITPGAYHPGEER